MQTIQLKAMGLAPATDLEIREIDGGGWGSWFKGFTVFGIAQEVISHWDEIKHGFSDGWNFDRKTR
jgi:hypothetical protein